MTFDFNKEDLHVQIFSEYNGWQIFIVHKDSGQVVSGCYWGHDDDSKGSGGERVFAQIIEALGYSVSVKDSY